MAVGRGLPLLLRGEARATSVDPRRRARHEDPALDRIAAMYASDPWLGPALDAALETQALLATHGGAPARGGRGGAPDPADGAALVGRLAATDAGPRTMVLQLDGWDTHANQDAALGRGLSQLAETIESLSQAMQPVWDQTVVVVVTEFGRAVQGNGTGGTDHGIGGMALLAGGAVAGGRVVSDWPGLSPRDLLDGRDLRPTIDLRGVLKGVLADHLQLTRRDLDTHVFPGSQGVSAVRDLIA